MVKTGELAVFALFEGVAEEELALLAGGAQLRRFKAGETIFQEGDPGGELCLIKEGEVKVSRLIREGESQGLGILKKGGYFGAISLLDGKPHSASVVALSDVVTIHVQRRDFEKLAQAAPACGVKLLRKVTASLCSFLRKMDAKFIDMVQYVSQNK